MNKGPKSGVIVVCALVGLVVAGAFAFNFYKSSQVEEGIVLDEFQTSEGVTPRVIPILADYTPHIQIVGEDGVIPEAIRVQFSRPITSELSSVPPDTQFVITPIVSGTWRYESNSVLIFRPSDSFKLKTSYNVRLVSVNIDGHTIKPDENYQVERVFETPDFAVKRANLSRINSVTGDHEFEVLFTGPVDYRKVGKFLRFTAGNSNIVPKYSVGGSKSSILAIVTAQAMANSDSVKVTINKGLPSTESGHQIVATQNLSVQLFEGADVAIKTTQLKEGTNGFYIQVICNDGARAPDIEDSYRNRIYYYDNETRDGMYVSDRCAPEEQSASQFISIQPKQDFSVVPSRGGFRILSEFKFGETTLTINAGLRTTDGGVVKALKTVKFNVPRRKPQVSVLAQGRYFSRDSWKNIALKHMNTPEAEVEIRHVPAENLVFWLSDDTEKTTDRNSNLILKSSIKFDGKPDVLETHILSLADVIHGIPRGVIEFSVRDKAGKSSPDQKRLIATNINLLVKRSEQGRKINVWALDFHKVQPLSGVEIKVITKSGRALVTCRSDSNGHCNMDWDKSKEVDPSEPFAMIASKESDLTYLKFSELKTEVSEQLIQGRPFTGGDTPYRAAIYSDRGVYRPGETAHIVSIVRAADNLAPPAEMPVMLELFDPREKLNKKLNLKLNTAGLADVDIKFESFAATGRYLVVVKAGDKEIGRYTFNVEDFMPERMKVDIKSMSDNLARDQEALFQIESRYLFGGSAGGSKVELNCELWPSKFTPVKNSNFFYGVYYADNKVPKSLALGMVNGQIGENDLATLACPISEKSGGFAGTASLQAKVAVFEGETGRSTQNSVSIPVHPESFYIGLSSGTQTLQKGDTFVFEGVVVDWNGEIVANDQDIQLEFVRLESEFDWSWDEGEGSSFKKYQRQVVESKLKVEVKNGRFKGSLPVNSNASGFLLKASLGKARTDLTLGGTDNDYYWWPNESSRDQTPKPLKPSWIQVTGPEVIKKGKNVTVEVTVPFKGRLLLTAETDRIIHSKWIDAGAGKTIWEFGLNEFFPNVYVSAFLIKDPHLESAESFMPDRAFGIHSFRVEPEDFSDSFKIEVADEIKPNTTLTVDLEFPKAEVGRFVTVAAVDEGILSLTRFKSPDPLRIIFEPRALGVETFETFGWNVMLPGSGPSSSHGGDGSENESPVSLVKPVALWSGVKQVPDNGKISVSLEVPQYRGQLRVMVVSSDKKRISSASAQVFVRDPLVLQTALPRFMTEGDQFDIPVTVTNMSGKAQEVALTLEVENIESFNQDESTALVSVVAPDISKVSVDLGASKTVVFKATTTATGGAVQFRVKAKAGSIESFEDLDVPILSAKPKSRVIKRVDVGDGTTDLKAHFETFVPGTEKTSIWITSNPYADSLQHLKYLVQYPYGCLEQSVSSTRPLLVIRDLLDQVDTTMFSDTGTVDDMVARGIARVLSMQTASGGFAYWPGSTTPADWATAYAIHMLLDAQKMKFPVAKERVDEALAYLSGKMVNSYGLTSSSANRSNADIKDAAPYIYFVLALGGKGLKADTETYLNYINSSAGGSRQGQNLEDKYLLMAALHLMGDHRFAGDLKHPDISTITGHRTNSWSFYSDFRRRGMMLSVFTDLFGSDAAGSTLADVVAGYLRGKRSNFFSTQELVWSVTGLGKFVAGGASDFDAELVVDGTKRKQQGKLSWIVNRATEKKSVVVNVDKKKEGKLYAVVVSDGVLGATDFKTGGESLEISRTYRKADGSQLNPESGVTLAGIIYTELVIHNRTNEHIDNIVLVDRFPAGWEIENPRLGRGSTANFIDPEQIWAADFMNIRDDRIEIFGALRPFATKKIYYASRAVLGGRFAIPPVEAEAMYDPRKWAREVGGVTNIRSPWDEISGQ